ncbi:hypothetical protein HYR99_09315 [Candidatus Poribacteria bacterium]|nr:hypothetical protein [Candidatus Poribacteria bacterium]
MKLNKKQEDKIIQSLMATWEQQKCPICHLQKWVISDTVYELREFAGGKWLTGAAVAPVVIAICTNCGNTLFFNAIHLGIIEPTEKETERE